MTISNVPTATPGKYWYRGADYEAGIVAGLHCPYCACELRASDVSRHDVSSFEIVCRECHRTVVLIEPLDNDEAAP